MRAIPGARMLAIATAIACASVFVALAAPASADTAPPNPTDPVTVAADPLPTVQINGVVWTQAIVGNTVYVGGEFTAARPAGAAAGTNETPRANLLAYDLTTGTLITSWNPGTNGRVNQIVATPDGTRIYVVGSFTTVGGATRYRAAAFDTATGALSSWAPTSNAIVYAVAATNDTVWLGGSFTNMNGQPRLHFAAYSRTGALLPWAPTTENGSVKAMVVNPAGTKLVVGGSFESVNGAPNPGRGLVALDAITGQILPFAVNKVVRNGGSSGGIFSLASDANFVYGTGWTYGRAGGTLEGTFKAAWSDGATQWVEDCHGDTYGVGLTAEAVYVGGHPHYCGNTPGGFPQTAPTWTFYRGLSFSQAVAGVATTDLYGYTNWAGTPAPRLLHWFPEINAGSFTGLNQGPWHITASADGRYVLYGGEFTRVNNRAQQGLVRFANPNVVPSKAGPKFSGAASVPTVLALASDAVRVNWSANSDPDNESLKYEVLRNNVVIHTLTALSKPWSQPSLGFFDGGVAPGATVNYRIRATDPNGNVSLSDSVAFTNTSSGTVTAYQRAVLSSATNYWPLNEPSGSVAVNWATNDPMNFHGTYTRGTAPAVNTGGFSTTFGAGAWAASTVPHTDSRTVSVEAWFRTTTNQGGKIVGFGSSNTGNSTNYDRHLYMQNNGRVTYGVRVGFPGTITSPTALNNGQWHHIVAMTSPAGSQLYVDGVLVGTRTDMNLPRPYTGYWRIGGDSLSGWPNQPSSSTLQGSIDDVATYSIALDAATVQSHNEIGRTGKAVNQAPTAAFTATNATALTLSVDGSTSTDPDGTINSYSWNFGDGASGTGATASHTYTSAGTYAVTLTVTDDAGATGTLTKSVIVQGPNAEPTASFVATASNLSVSVDGSGSNDPDGSIAAYAWNFGDGSTSTGAITAHTYAAPGTYPITLTVTDNRGGTATTTRQVTLVQTVVAQDDFNRVTAGSLGTANVGGAWSGTGAGLSTNGSTGNLSINAGQTLQTTLPGATTSNLDLSLKFALTQPITGSGVYVSTIARQVGADTYLASLRIYPTGVVNVKIQRSGVTLVVTDVAGLTYTTGQQLNLRFQVFGTSPTTLRARVWSVGQPEPSTWLLSTTDSTAALQTAGNIGLIGYLSGSATNPVTIAFDDLLARPVN
ncbi:MAG TPA: PKD domain-containing protein [Candidatus Lumbricidophila sp.]|nr:PKD domain-containing protein [Candidatus Lumbricidophila sp.]